MIVSIYTQRTAMQREARKSQSAVSSLAFLYIRPVTF